MPDVEHTIQDDQPGAEIHWRRQKKTVVPLPGLRGSQERKSTPVPRFPQELADLIISHLTSDDTHTLAACALVARSFLGASRSVLFHTVTLTGSGSSFYKLVASPYCSLSFRVQCLQLVLNRRPFLDLSALLAFLGSVTSLSIDTVCQGLVIHLLVRTPTPAFSLITFVKLRGTRFQTFNSLTTFILSFPALRTMILMCLTWEESTLQTPKHPLPQSLHTLHVFSNSGTILQWILSASSSVPPLATLIVGDVTANDAPTLYKFVTAVGITLRHLSVRFQNDEEEAEDLICAHPDLERIPELRIVRHHGMSIMKV